MSPRCYSCHPDAADVTSMVQMSPRCYRWRPDARCFGRGFDFALRVSVTLWAAGRREGVTPGPRDMDDDVRKDRRRDPVTWTATTTESRTVGCSVAIGDKIREMEYEFMVISVCTCPYSGHPVCPTGTMKNSHPQDLQCERP
jgi:hypothetical protein